MRIIIQFEGALSQAGDAQCQLRWSTDTGGECAAPLSGTLAELKQWLLSNPLSSRPATLLLSGDQVVSRSLSIAVAEQRHLPRLLPFLLEPELAVDLSRVHIAHRRPKMNRSPADMDGDEEMRSHHQGQVDVAYTDRQQLERKVAVIEQLGLELDSIYALPALLDQRGCAWTLLLDGDICHLRLQGLLCLSVALDALEPVLELALREAFSNDEPQSDESQSDESQSPTLSVLVPSDERSQPRVTALLQRLTAHGALQQAGIRVDVQYIPHVWAALNSASPVTVNLRQGELRAPLRVRRYWTLWRIPALAAMLAISATLLMAALETSINHQRYQALETQLTQRYREVMPDGVLVDAEQQLAAQLARYRQGTAGPSLTRMLHEMLAPFADNNDISLHRLSYQLDAGMQINISAADTADILKLSADLTAAGWPTQAKNIRRSGTGQQASLLIRSNDL